MSTHVARSPGGAPLPPARRATRLTAARPWSLARAGAGTWTTLGVAAVLAFVCFAANGGQQLGSTTKVEMLLDVVAGLAIAAAALATPHRGRVHGLATAGALFALAAWTALSVTWAANGSDAWIEANRTISYALVFGAALALVRVAPQRWESVLGGIVLGSVVIAGYALLTRVFPGALASDELYARLRAPFGYWNATGLSAAMAIPPALWLGARRQGHAALNALAFPAVGVLLCALLLSYSRGSLLALGVGLGFWLLLVPLRLRGVAVLVGGAIGAVPVALWAFAQKALTTDGLPSGLRSTAGHQLGGLLVAMLLVLVAIGLAAGFALATKRPDDAERRNAVGLALLVLLALAPIALGGYLFTTHRGFTGSISHGFKTLTDPHASSPPNDPGRLTSVGSVRSRYWNEALKMFVDHPVKGVGAGGYATVRPFYRDDTLQVRHAHGYVVQTLADLGIVGALLSLAVLAAWLASTRLALGLRRVDRGRPMGPERIGLVTMASVVLVFGVHSFVDWTFFVPGCTIVALLCAAWVAGRGPLQDEAEVRALGPAPAHGVRSWLDDRRLAGAAALGVLACVVVAWVAWQPLRSQDASDKALAALERGDVAGAERDARTAHDRDPLSLDPLDTLALAQAKGGRLQDAEGTLRRATALQPANSDGWLRLADFQLNQLKNAGDAVASLRNALYLDPRDPKVIGAYLAAKQAAGTG